MAESGDGSLPAYVLPLLTRSASLLTLLLQDGAVDLELTSSVVAMDPGLAFGVLQLANHDGAGESDPVWQFPMAVVSAGREAMLRLAGRAARVESDFHGRRAALLRELYTNAVARAAVAQFLGRELGDRKPHKAYLAGLMAELPLVVKTTFATHAVSRAELLTAMCRALPAAAVTAAVAAVETGEDTIAPDAIVSAVRIADSVVLLTAAGDGDAAQLETLASAALWRSWHECDLQQRLFLLTRGRTLAKWAAANVSRMDPWEFMARLERRSTWE